MGVTYVCVDVETTGLAPDVDEIIEIGAVKCVDGQVVDTFQSLVQPTQSIPSFVQSLTGITDDMVADAPPFGEIAKDFLRFLGDGVFVAHHVSFDLDSINSAYTRLGMDTLDVVTLDTRTS